MNIDSLLEILTRVVWVLFFAFSALSLIRDVRKRNIVYALQRLFTFRNFSLLFVAAGLTLLSAAVVFIEPQEAAVVVSAVSPNGYQAEPMESGLHLIVPLAEEPVHYPIYWQTYTMSGKPTEGEVIGNDSITARTNDGQAVLIDCSVIFRIDVEQLVRVHIDWQDRYISDFVRPRTRGLVRTLASQFEAIELNSASRADLEEQLNQQLSAILEDQGFELDTFVLRNIAFSPEFAEAVELKKVAEQGVEQKQFEAQQIRELALGQADRARELANGRADALRIEAQGAADARIIRSAAEAEALLNINQAIAQNRDLLVYEYVNKISPNIRVMLVPNNAPVVLPVPSQEIFPNANVPVSTLAENPLDATTPVTPTDEPTEFLDARSPTP
jgi:regulator of protease activity HflC (stomatin/prohibitin superfamily)